MPAPKPRMVLKLPCPPPGKSCYYCIFHNLISFFSCIFSFFLFLIKYKTFFGHALAHYATDRILVNPSFVVPLAPILYFYYSGFSLYFQAYLNKRLNRGGTKIKSPITTAIMVTNITAPAEISFAIPTSFEYLL